ncbi:unnamed protein product [Caenorhabditis nigoni]
MVVTRHQTESAKRQTRRSSTVKSPEVQKSFTSPSITKKPVQKKSTKKSKKPSKNPHPPFAQMILEAISDLSDQKNNWISKFKIAAWICKNYSIPRSASAKHFTFLAINKAVCEEILDARTNGTITSYKIVKQ